MILASTFKRKKSKLHILGKHGKAEREDDPNLQGAAKDDQKLENSRVYQEPLSWLQRSPGPHLKPTLLLKKKKSENKPLSRVLWLSQVARISIYLPTTADVWLKNSPLEPHMRQDHEDSIYVSS